MSGKIEKNPQIAPKSSLLKGIHKNVVTKQTSFYYLISGNEIHIITLTDNRQNPKKTIKELREFLLKSLVKSCRKKHITY